ncbi:MAG TPA: class I SAM-dependent methyltransferase [Actinocrinis sp.]|uniref:SAM-dependent methyltransferase n=1 Tax=Actinocrinis sp. TaxID=1920516 RepID=UPI002D2E1DEF|nr:class I SAM-dependent methyltransferase [Actinocrinis sp.]HZU57905.1 class I SAM-dependent methyltransferase [Actinocrinis sp.]
MTTLHVAGTTRNRAPRAVAQAATLGKVLTTPQVPLLLALSKRFVTPLYRATFLASAAGNGLLRWMAVRPCDLETLAIKLGVEGKEDKRRLRAWLEVGVRLGEFDKHEGCYRLKSRSAKLLARMKHDALAAALEEIMQTHVPVLLNAPQMLRAGQRFTMADQDGSVIARSTRVVEPLVEAAIDATLEREYPVRLLEIGCGSGTYVRYAASLNPRLTALAIDLQDEVARQAAKNIAEWGLTDRVEVRTGDLRTLQLEPQFDLVTMHNNIYYFAPAERVAILERARRLLAPGGKLLLTTSCKGGHVGLDLLNLWFEYADFGGPLPAADELVEQFTQAGFLDAQARRIVPGEQFRAFTGTNPHAPLS